MEGYQHPYSHQHHQQPQPRMTAAAGGETPTADRFPQWSAQETKEFLIVRAEMDKAFMETKRNKILWEVISTRLKEKGFSRSAEQCKSKWKNLVTRYKGCETMEEDQAMRMQQFPFYNELHTIFSARLHHMLWAEAEGSGATATAMGRKRKGKATMSSEDDDDDDDDVEEGDYKGDSSDDGENRGRKTKNKNKNKNKNKKKKNEKSRDEFDGGGLREVLEGFMRQQAAMEERWREEYEAREEERRRREVEWRREMAAMEEERRRIERSWREREEERRVREEARANNRDALINALLNRLRRDM